MKFIKNKSVLITGSSGTIGGELLKLCLKYKAEKIIAVDHNEFGQYKLLEKGFNNVFVHVVSVLNKPLIKKILNNYNPDIVIHAAAYKHVHLSEFSPSSAIQNNILEQKILLIYPLNQK